MVNHEFKNHLVTIYHPIFAIKIFPVSHQEKVDPKECRDSDKIFLLLLLIQTRFCLYKSLLQYTKPQNSKAQNLLGV